MGIYDREYYRDDEAPGLLSGRSMVVNLIILNVAIMVLDLLFFRKSERLADGSEYVTYELSNALSLKSNLFSAPWNCWQLLTYGFVHAPRDLAHILFNMLGLWFFGTEMETVYGRMEFLRIYLTLIIMSGLIWVISVSIAAQSISSDHAVLIGASGGVVGVLMLYVLHYPYRKINLFGIIPIQAWALGTAYILYEMYRAIVKPVGPGAHVSYIAHLAGAGFAFLYFKSGWNLGRLVPSKLSRLSLSSLKIKPKLRVHDPEADERELSRQVDRILEKIHRDGEASLTKKERKTLEEASKRYQRKRQ